MASLVRRTVGTSTLTAAASAYPLLSAARIVAVSSDATAVVEIENVAVLAPDLTVTVGENATNVCSDVRSTLNPEAGASADRVTVPVAVAEATTVEGETARPVIRTGGGSTTRTSVAFFAEGSVPVIVVLLEAATGSAVTENVAVLEPDATVTDAGVTATLVSLDDSSIFTPAVPAALVRVTVPVAMPPPIAGFGEIEMLEICWPKAPTDVRQKKKTAISKIKGRFWFNMVLTSKLRKPSNRVFQGLWLVQSCLNSTGRKASSQIRMILAAFHSACPARPLAEYYNT